MRHQISFKQNNHALRIMLHSNITTYNNTEEKEGSCESTVLFVHYWWLVKVVEKNYKITITNDEHKKYQISEYTLLLLNGCLLFWLAPLSCNYLA